MKRRRQTVHDVKRRLLAKMDALPDDKVRDILVEIRDYAIARRFLAGYSVQRIQSDDRFNFREWSESSIEESIRSHAKATKGRQRR